MKTQNGNKEKLDLHIEGNTSYTRLKKSQSASKASVQETWYYLGLVGDIGFTIAIPIAGGAIAGKYLDGVWKSYPKATLWLLFLGIIISLVGFIQKVIAIIKLKQK